MTAAAHGSATTHEVMLQLLAEGAAVCKQAGRPDLAQRLSVAAARIRRPMTIVCVVGEYKQGKSQLINALVDREICPVDDDLATTAITIIGHGEPTAYVRRHVDGAQTVDEIPFDEVPLVAAESVDGAAPAGIDLVEVAIPSSFLERGIAIVDTPGVNAFRPGDEQAVLDFLPYADGLILVTDAAVELSQLELRFLADARRACPTVLVALSKTDLYPEWRRIADLDREHLAKVGLADSLIPVSSALRTAAVDEERDADLDRESGFTELMGAIETGMVDGAREQVYERAGDDLARTIAVLRATEVARLEALEDPDAAAQRLTELRRAHAAMSLMREASSKWMVVLNDGISDVRSDVEHRYRMAIREQVQQCDRRLAESPPAAVWEELISDLKSSLADLAQDSFDAVRDGADQIAGRIAALIAEDTNSLASLTGDETVQIDALWSSSDRELKSGGANVVSSGLSMLRGGYSGMLMLGMLAQLAGVALLGPLALGAGALFGARQFREERQRNVERQRQEARSLVRQFLDHVQLELGACIQHAVQDAYRGLRDHFGEHIRELSATYAHATKVLQESLAADDAKRAQLTAAVRQRTAELDRLSNALATGTAAGR